MNIDFLWRLLLFVVLLLVQALVLNHIHLFGYATPLLYLYLVASFRRGYPRWGILLWSFLMGLSVDVFCNTPGLAAATMTLAGLIQPYLLQLFLPRDSAEDLRPSLRTLGFTRYLLYTLLLTTAYSLVFFTIEHFSFFDWTQWALCILGSTLLTTLLILVVDNMKKTR